MIISRTKPINKIEIWQPRYHDRTVLIATYKVKQDNVIIFTKAKHLPDEYYLSGETIKKYPVETNGTISCYVVPMKELDAVERVWDEVA